MSGNTKQICTVSQMLEEKTWFIVLYTKRVCCIIGYIKSALLVWIDQNSLHWAQKLSSLHKFHSYCKVHYNGKHD